METLNRVTHGDPVIHLDPPRGGLAPRALRRVREHGEARLAEKIDLATMAGLAGLSPPHFARAFKQSVGTPPYRYVLRRRIDLATRLLENTDRPLADIALDVAFYCQSHFARTFGIWSVKRRVSIAASTAADTVAAGAFSSRRWAVQEAGQRIPRRLQRLFHQPVARARDHHTFHMTGDQPPLRDKELAGCLLAAEHEHRHGHR